MKRKCQYFEHVIRACVVDPKIVTERQNSREERTGETKRYLDKKHQRMVRIHL